MLAATDPSLQVVPLIGEASLELQTSVHVDPPNAARSTWYLKVPLKPVAAVQVSGTVDEVALPFKAGAPGAVMLNA